MKQNRIIRFIILTGLSALLLFAEAGCFLQSETVRVETAEPVRNDPEATVADPETITAEPIDPEATEETVICTEEAPNETEEPLPQDPSGSEETTPEATQEPTPEATREPESAPTQAPTSTPQPTRAPIEGDITGTVFPSEDTGRDADWSYQSDELRVAVTRCENEDDQIVYYVADIRIRNIRSFRMEFANGKYQAPREDPEDFANRINAVFAISGTMNSGFIVHNGVKYKNAEGSSSRFRSGIVAVYRDGSVKVFNLKKNQKFNYNKENKQNGGLLHALQFGPVLVQDGKIPSGLKTKERHPRIIFGCCEPGHYIAVAVDGRTKKSVGMTEQEMAELMLSLGCTDAINLDGGNSAVMLFMGKTINIPSGKDRDGDGIGGRNILDLLAFAEYDEDGVAPDLSDLHADRMREE